MISTKINSTKINSTKININNIQEFKTIIENNPGLVIIKYGAEWCGPCKKIDPLVKDWFDKFNENTPTVQTILVDVDTSFELYSFMKNKKMVQGIPAIHCYEKGTKSHIPNDMVFGASPLEINKFFNRCLQKL